MDTTTSVWQSLMDKAYDFWQGKDISYRQFINSRPHAERVAVLLGNLNYQVENGGFQQWVDNGYACHGKEVAFVLTEIGTDMANQLAEKIGKLLDYVDLSRAKTGFGDYWLREDEDDYEDGSLCEGERLAESYDDWYYKECSPVLRGEIEDYLRKLTA